MIRRTGGYTTDPFIDLLFNALLGFTLLGRDFSFSGKELILLAGGVFLIYKATKEIHNKLEGEDDAQLLDGPPSV